MQCFKPIQLLNPKTHTYMSVPCNKCLGCRMARSSEWALRCLHELPYWEDSSFVTLTYAAENLIEGNTLSKIELQLFFKRLRKNLTCKPKKKEKCAVCTNKKCKIKYYACGEYGDEKKRPHYHAIIFGISKNEHKTEKRWDNRKKKFYHIVKDGVLTDSWKNGEVQIGTVTYDSCRYVAGYLDQKLYGEKQKQTYNKTSRLPPFQLVSAGLGLRYAVENQEQLYRQLYTTIQGVKVPIPRYYKKKLDLKADLFESFIKNQSEKTYDNIIKKLKLNEKPKNLRSKLYHEQLIKAREQNEVSLNKRMSLKHDKKNF
nr:MAG: replication initiator protein [Microvirus sp.]